MNNLPADESPAASPNPPTEANAVQPSTAQEAMDSHKPGPIRRFFSDVWDSLALRRVVFKALTLIYALAVFGYAYIQMSAHRNILSYMGVMLLMVIVYAEILVIRDHLWVIEGSMRESRRWRDVFFNQTSLRRQRIRKFFSILFSLGIFSYMYIKAGPQHKPVLSFMGIMLMMTVLYYEILTIRDEIFVIGQSLAPCSDEESDKRKQQYDKFIDQSNNAAAGVSPTSETAQEKPAEAAKKEGVPEPAQASEEPLQNG